MIAGGDSSRLSGRGRKRMALNQNAATGRATTRGEVKHGLLVTIRLRPPTTSEKVKGENMNSTTYVEEIELNVEEMEEVIAPALSPNHNETVEVDLSVEEMEEVIAPALAPNHNETAEVDLNVEEMEEVIA